MNEQIQNQMEKFLAIKHPNLLVPFMFGHIENITDDIVDEFCNWLDEIDADDNN